MTTDTSAPPNDQERLSSIGHLAAKLCYMDNCPADNICIGSCAAVCPSSKYLEKAAGIIFREYWLSHPRALIKAKP